MDSAPKSIAGHPPAVKVGGMRVARRRTSSGPGAESSKQTKPKEANGHTTNGTVENGDTLKSGTDATSTPSESVDAVPEKEKDKTAELIDKEERALRKRQQHEANLLIAGAMTRGDEDFPTAAVRAFHEKPEPARNRPRQSEPQPTFQKQNRVIQQPSSSSKIGSSK